MRALLSLLAFVSLPLLAASLNDGSPLPTEPTAARIVAAADSTRYSKIANSGSELPDSAALGSGALDWACTRDNTTGLLWEVKTADGGLRDQNKGYTNYDDTTQKQVYRNGGYFEPTQAEVDAASNSIGFTNAVNAGNLCGQTDWRLPSKDELLGLVDQSYYPAMIDPAFFPNSGGSNFWSGTPYASQPSTGWFVTFGGGYAYANSRNSPWKVRLVRHGQPSGIFALTLGTSGSGSGSVASNTGGMACTSTAGTASGTCSASFASGTAVTLTATAASGSSFTGWGGACSGSSATCTLTMDAAKTVTATFTAASSSRYSKIANNGSVLSDSAVLGSGALDWACTRDNTTGLLWEVKTADGGLRDQNKLYTNYDNPDLPQTETGNPTQAEIDAGSNSVGFAKAVNATALCNQRDWRVPSLSELQIIVDHAYQPTINPTYFPTTPASFFWSSSPYSLVFNMAYYMYFKAGAGNEYYRSHGLGVQLVSGGQAASTFVLSLNASGTGSGSMTGNAGSIDCRSTAGTSAGTCSASLASGTAVTLTATPASGSNFGGWSGACSGTSSTCTLTMDAAKNVSAAFNSAPASQSISFGAAPSVAVGGIGSVSASATSGLAVTFSSLTTSICSVSGSIVTGISVGTCTIAADQDGNGSYSPAPQVTQSFGIAAASARYSKIANNGSVLADSAALGSGASDWACTRDNTTGLIWEVKTTDGGLRDKSHAYTNYDSNYGTPSQIAAASNSIGFASAVNAAGLCGHGDWRMPGKDELLALIDTAYTPKIDPIYFPNTQSSVFWSGSSYADNSSYAWDVYFNTGVANKIGRNNGNYVRLVRGGNFDSLTALSASPVSPAQAGQTTTLTVQVSGTMGTPTGNVVFNDAAVFLGTVALNGSGGATFATNFRAGQHSLSASYTGDAVYRPSQASLSYQVNDVIGTTLGMTSSPNPSQPGQSVVVTVNVTPASTAGTLSGTVSVSGGGQSCSIVLPAVSCTLVFASKGTKTLNASYGGNSHYAASTASASHQVGKRAGISPILLLLLE